MANVSSIHVLFFAFITSGVAVSSATVFTLENSCPYTVWPGILSGNSNTLGDGGFPLAPGASVQLSAPPGWSGRFWARTGCTFDSSGRGACVTGDCGGALKCTGNGVPPATLAEFTVGSSNSGMDFYDVSLVDGYNVEMGIRPEGGTGDCRYAGCVSDINEICPSELRIVDPGNGGNVAACKSACAAFSSPEFCCTGAHATPQTCSPTQYSRMFKNACPSAYSYAYDDETSTFTCNGANYVITFCPAVGEEFSTPRKAHRNDMIRPINIGVPVRTSPTKPIDRLEYPCV